MKKVLIISLACMLTLGVPAMTVSASSLDDVVNQSQSNESAENLDSGTVTQPPVTAPVENTAPETNNSSQVQRSESNADYINNLKNATNLSAPSEGANKINQGITKAASFVIQVISWFITACLVIRIVLDLCYITIPFTRGFLGNGHQGNAQQQGQPGMGAGMGGMGMGAGMGGMSGGFGGGYNRMGMGGMGGMGAGMGAQQQQQPVGRVQWVSNAALNAAASEQLPIGPDGQKPNALKMYAKEMTVVLIVTPLLLVLGISGALTNLGFLLGDLLTQAIGSIGNMM